MLTSKQIQLLKLIYIKEEIQAKDGRRVYSTYNGFYNATRYLKSIGLITWYNDFLYGCRRYQLTPRGEKFVKRN
jgi:hypothetical protein